MKKTIYFTIVLTLLVSLSFTTVQAIDIGELEQQRLELKEKISKSGVDLENINIELTDNLEEINKLNEEIYEYENQIRQSSISLEHIEKQIKQTEQQLEKLEEKYNQRKEILQNRLVALYEAGKTRISGCLIKLKKHGRFYLKILHDIRNCRI